MSLLRSLASCVVSWTISFGTPTPGTSVELIMMSMLIMNIMLMMILVLLVNEVGVEAMLLLTSDPLLLLVKDVSTKLSWLKN